ncbi:MAG TPA: polysaccharide deacetylase family protein [Conexibacter sp.]|nr:polysaccharide deacetylase family protein [Conexibacter sp.]
MTDHSTPTAAAGSAWLAGSAAAFLITIPVDCEACMLSIGSRYAKHPLVMSHQRYEINRGLPRLIELLGDLGLPATFFAPGWTLERHPEVAQLVLGAGHELAHHSYSHRRPVELGEAEERADFERALGVLERLGVAPSGHRAAYWSPSAHTLDLVAEYGLRYDTSLMGDDRPYLVDTPHGEVIELPPFWGLDDWEQYAWLPEPDIGRVIEPPHLATAVWRDELEAIRSHGGLLQLTCHAFLSGRPGRVEGLRRLFEHALALRDVTFLNCEQAAERAAADPGLTHRDVPLFELESGLPRA